jgi:hypothetical protein
MKANKKYKIPSSFDSKEYFQTFRVKSLIHYQQNLQSIALVSHQTRTASNSSVSEEVSDETHSFTVDCLKPRAITNIKKLKKDSQSGDGSVFLSINDEKPPLNETDASEPFSRHQSILSSSTTSNNQNITRLLEEGEKINYIYRCARVLGLDTTEGVFLFGKEHFYVLDGFTQISNKEIVDMESLKSSAYEPLITKSSCGRICSCSS